MCLVVSIRFRLRRLVTDRQTDRQTRDDSIYRASVASRGQTKFLQYLLQYRTRLFATSAEIYKIK